MIFISLIAMLGLLSQHRARSAGGPIPVQVTNDPLATTETALTGAQEYLVQTSVSIPNGSADGFTSVTVPTGKRLIVETVSIYRSGSGLTTQSVQAFIGRHDTLNGDFALPVVASSSTASPGSTLAIRCYFDPGSTVYLASHRSGTSGAEAELCDGLWVPGQRPLIFPGSDDHRSSKARETPIIMPRQKAQAERVTCRHSGPTF